ncbi:RICIN domain-containing protein [Micromonospora sp. NPDC049114]|uniref:RICIN domain-containing protein n=2 Tax=unclassified Micromonospora TaxID=2617518 RepID=UPI0033E9EFAC
MTQRATLRSRWRRVMATTRGQAEVVALTLTIVLCGALALDVVPAVADNEKLVGRPVADEDVPSLVAAALSCPALTPPKMAAQVMAATAFGSDGANKGLAGMDDATWSKWRPSADANRTDPAASVLAMAHRTCEVVGQLRAADVDGDLWAAAMAADKVGLQAVIKAKGVPKTAEDHVDKVTAYANWYADQPQFRLGRTAEVMVSPSADQTVAVPATLVSAVNAAGRVCPTVTPARIAAQLRALSGFNTNLRSPSGAAGIAQFSDSMWDQYKPGTAASVWNPDDAILAMGAAMCDMTNQFVGLSGGDAYTLALGAYQWGIDVIRRANGLPRANVPQLADEVVTYISVYEKDSRLTTAVVKPTPSASPSKASPSASPSASASAPAPKVTTKAPAKPATFPFDPNARYQIRSAWAAATLDLPGDSVKPDSGTRVQLWNNQNAKDQYWRIQKAKTDGYVMFLNDFTGQALAIENGSTDNYAKVVVATKDVNSTTQQWKITDAGDGKVSIENRKSGRVMELLGDDLGPQNAGTWNGYFVEQYDRMPTVNRDQFWMLVK